MDYALDNIVSLIDHKEPLPTGFARALQQLIDITLNRGIYTINVAELFRQIHLKLDSTDLNGSQSYVNCDVIYKLLSILDRRGGVTMVPISVPASLSVYNNVYLLKKPDLSIDQDVALIMSFAKERPTNLTNAQLEAIKSAQIKLRNYNILVRVFESLGAAQTGALDANQRAVLNDIMSNMLLPHDGVRYLRSLYSYACDYGSYIYDYTNPKYVSRALSVNDQLEVIDIVARTVAPSHTRINVPDDFPWKTQLESRYSEYCPRIFDIASADNVVKVPVNERPISALTASQKRTRLKKHLNSVLAALKRAPTAKTSRIVAGIDIGEFNSERRKELLMMRTGFSPDFIRRVGELTALDDPDFAQYLMFLQSSLASDEKVRLTLPNFQQSFMQLVLLPPREGTLEEPNASAKRGEAEDDARVFGFEYDESDASANAAYMDDEGYINPRVFLPELKEHSPNSRRQGYWQTPQTIGVEPFHVLVFTWDRLNHLYHNYLMWADSPDDLRPNVNSDYGNLPLFILQPPRVMHRLDRINFYEYVLRKMFAPEQNSCALLGAGHGDEVDYQHLFELESRSAGILIYGWAVPMLFYHSLYYFDKYLENPSTHFGNEIFYLNMFTSEPFALNSYLSRICYKYGSRLVDIPEEFFTLIALNLLVFPQQVLAESCYNLSKYLFKRAFRSGNLYRVVVLRLLAHRLYRLVHEREDLQDLRLEMVPVAQGRGCNMSAWDEVDDQDTYFWTDSVVTINKIFNATCSLLPDGIVSDKNKSFVRTFVTEFCSNPILFYKKLAPELLSVVEHRAGAKAAAAKTKSSAGASVAEEIEGEGYFEDDRFGEKLPRFQVAGARAGDSRSSKLDASSSSVGASYFLRQAKADAAKGHVTPHLGTGGAYATVSQGHSTTKRRAGTGDSIADQLKEATLGIKRLNANAKAELLDKVDAKTTRKRAITSLMNYLKWQYVSVLGNPSLMASLIEESSSDQLSASRFAAFAKRSSGTASADAESEAEAERNAVRKLLDQLLGTAAIAALETLGGLKILQQKSNDWEKHQEYKYLDSSYKRGYVVSSIEAKRQRLNDYFLSVYSDKMFSRNNRLGDEFLAPLYTTYVVPVIKRLLFKDFRYLYAFSQVLPVEQIMHELQAKIENDFIRDYKLDGVENNLCIINSFVYGPKEERYGQLRNFVLRSDDAYHLGFTSGIKVEQMYELSLLLRRNLQVQIVPLFYPNVSEDNFSRLRPRVSHIHVLEIPEYFLHAPQEQYDNVLDSLYCAYVILELMSALLPINDKSGLITLFVQEISALHQLQHQEDCVRFAYEYLECALQIIELEGPLKAEQLLDEKLKLDLVLMGNRGTKRLKFFLTMAFSFEFQHSFVTQMVTDYYNQLLERLHCIDDKSTAATIMDRLCGNYSEGRITGRAPMSRLELDMDKIKAKLKESEQVQRVITELREKEQQLEQQAAGQSSSTSSTKSTKKKGKAATTSTKATRSTKSTKATSSDEAAASAASGDSVDVSGVKSSEMKFIAGALQGAEAMAKRDALHAQSLQGAIAEAQARAQNSNAINTDDEGKVVSSSTHPINSKLSDTARKVIEAIAVQGTDAMVYREFNGLCVSHGMLSGNYCIELLNDYSYEVYDEPVLELDGEGDGAIVYITTEVLQDMQQHINNLKKG